MFVKLEQYLHDRLLVPKLNIFIYFFEVKGGFSLFYLEKLEIKVKKYNEDKFVA